MKGEIFCESEKGQGAKFTFYIKVGCHNGDTGLNQEE